jgi:pSer/pThr/pTyr-binding forkhead associated (FHA) protein
MSNSSDIIEIKRGNDIKEYPISKKIVTLGRATGNDIILNDDYASRFHAKLEYSNNDIYVTDLNSKNGTRINKLKLEPYKPHLLKDNDEIIIGDFSLTYRTQQTMIMRSSTKTEESKFTRMTSITTWVSAAAAIIVVAAIIVAGVLWLPQIVNPQADNITTASTAENTNEESISTTVETNDFINAVAKVKPAVVYIEVSDGSGSGVIIDENGYILTCNHVVENVSSIKVTVLDSGQFDGEVVVRDKDKDLAIIKINPGDFSIPVATLGNSNTINIGQEVAAIGYPLGWISGASVSRGIISAKRDLPWGQLLQTDTQVNPGNSGGPLINIDGEIIGIVSWKFYGTNDTPIEGMGFAVAIDDIKHLINTLN